MRTPRKLAMKSFRLASCEDVTDRGYGSFDSIDQELAPTGPAAVLEVQGSLRPGSCTVSSFLANGNHHRGQRV